MTELALKLALSRRRRRRPPSPFERVCFAVMCISLCHMTVCAVIWTHLHHPLVVANFIAAVASFVIWHDLWRRERQRRL